MRSGLGHDVAMLRACSGVAVCGDGELKVWDAAGES